MAVPETNAREAAVVDGIEVLALKSLPQAVDLVNSPRVVQAGARGRAADARCRSGTMACDFWMSCRSFSGM